MHPSLRGSSSLVATAVTVLGGCTTPVVDEVADANLGRTEGVVLIERIVGTDGSAQSNVSAKFMRFGTPADPELAERVVGSKLDLPSVGACRRLLNEPVKSRSPTFSTLGTIELIDVGDVTLRAGTDRMPLAARAFPDVGGELVSGMFYTSRDATSDLPAGTFYTLEGTGSSQVEHFAIEVEAPHPPEDVRLGDILLSSSPALLALEEGRATAVAWRSWPSPTQGRADRVLIDISAESGMAIRCAFHDTGSAVLPSWVLAPAMLGALPATATIAVHRVRERSFVANGIDVGEVRFDLSVVGRVAVSPRPAVQR